MKKYLLVFISAMLLWSCEDTEILDPTGELVVTEFNLPLLPTGYVYEGWLLVGGTYVSVGTINNDSINNNRARFSRIEKSDLSLAESFAITVENTSSPAPSNYVLLVGDFDGNTANLLADGTSSNGITTLGGKISAAYTLQNATVTENSQNYTENGIWFFKGSGDLRETTLALNYEELRYQAWFETQTVQGTSRLLNMGIIASDTLRDSRNAYTSQNTALIPEFAGEDFLTTTEGETYPEGFFPRNVTGSKVFITPIFNGFINAAETPFPIRLLVSEIPTGVTNDVNTTYPMELNTNFGATATKL